MYVFLTYGRRIYRAAQSLSMGFFAVFLKTLQGFEREGTGADGVGGGLSEHYFDRRRPSHRPRTACALAGNALERSVRSYALAICPAMQQSVRRLAAGCGSAHSPPHAFLVCRALHAPRFMDAGGLYQHPPNQTFVISKWDGPYCTALMRRPLGAGGGVNDDGDDSTGGDVARLVVIPELQRRSASPAR